MIYYDKTTLFAGSPERCMHEGPGTWENCGLDYLYLDRIRSRLSQMTAMTSRRQRNGRERDPLFWPVLKSKVPLIPALP